MAPFASFGIHRLIRSTPMVLLLVFISLATTAIAGVCKDKVRISCGRHMLVPRGGSTPPVPPYSSSNQQRQQQYQPPQKNQYEYPPENEIQYKDDRPPMDRETVQDRVDAWRRTQRERYPLPSDGAQAADSGVTQMRDDEGRMNLLATVSRGSRAFIFFILMWRNVHLFEVADQLFKGNRRLAMVIPTVLLFVANLAGVVTSLFTSPSHSSKKRLKAILNLDKLVEVIMIFYGLGRLTLFPSKYTPREVYIAGIIHSLFFITQTQVFTKLTWDQVHYNKDLPMAPSASIDANPSYDKQYQPMPYDEAQRMPAQQTYNSNQ